MQKDTNKSFNTQMLNLFKKANIHKDRVAIQSDENEFTYGYLIERSNAIASFLLGDQSDLNEERIGLLVRPDINYVAALWGIWKSGAIAVPLSLSAKESELEHYISDSNIRLIISSDNCEEQKNIPDRAEINIQNIEGIKEAASMSMPTLSYDRQAMIIYTSGTTNKPKGVLTTHGNIEAQITALVEAWKWTKDDHIPLILPLHHIHGIINSLCCPLYVGAKVSMLGGFNVDNLCKEITRSDYTVFTAVPTIYFSLIEKMEKTNEAKILNGFKKLRLMMSGSAALAPEIHKKWEALTGQKILERYGMTEVGMALSNKIDGERRPGAVGEPLPNVEIRLEDENGNDITEEGEIGQILLKGPQVFSGYQNLPEKTEEAFKEGWFLTGDVAVMEGGYYRLLGRDSIDIIKSGGYKISALEIEDVLLKNKNVKECAVLAKNDEKWGEIVVAAIIPKNKAISEEELQNWCSMYLSDYKIPRIIKLLDQLPKNSMGKVTKNELKNLFNNP